MTLNGVIGLTAA